MNNDALAILNNATIEFTAHTPWCPDDKGFGHWHCAVLANVEHENGLRMTDVFVAFVSGINAIDAGAKAGALAAMFDLFVNRDPGGRAGMFMSFVEVWKLEEAVRRWLATRGQA
jgi:hypothetical protein